MQRQPFREGYLGDWSEEIFEIRTRLPTVPVTYELRDLLGESIKGRFYGKIGMTFEYQSQVKVTADFSPDLARLSGLCSDESYVTGDDVISERELNLTSSIHSVYVYCDLLKHVPVGDTKELLLRIVDKSTELEGNVHRVFNPTLYVPLQKKCFYTMEIDMMIDTGDPVRKVVRRLGVSSRHTSVFYNIRQRATRTDVM